MAILSSEVIPKERLSAYQRWEVGTLEESVATDLPRDDSSVERLRNEAIAAGHAEGHAAGLAQAAVDRVRYAALIASMENAIAGHQQELADSVLDFALTLACKMVHTTISVRRELLRPVITAALEQLPQGVQRIRLSANPADVEIARAMFATEPGAEQWQIRPDAAVTAGGFRIETDQCEIDATVETRWGRLLESLGREGEWLEPDAKVPT